MADKTERIIDGLRSLSEKDFDYMNTDSRGIETLGELCDQVAEIENPETVFPVFFEVMERLPDADLGCPGAMVHTMESYDGKYEGHLKDSLKRKPTELSVLMVNRILNAPTGEKREWMELLVSASKHEGTTEAVRAEAARYIEYQKSK
jgi:hypothetical protein